MLPLAPSPLLQQQARGLCRGSWGCTSKPAGTAYHVACLATPGDLARRVASNEDQSTLQPSPTVDMAARDLEEYCTLLGEDEEATECWSAYLYLDKLRAQVLQRTDERAEVARDQLEGLVRQLMSRGDIRDSVSAMATLAHLDAKTPTSTSVPPEASDAPGSVPGLPPADDPKRREALLLLFARMDDDLNGVIDAAQFREAMRLLGDELSGDATALIFEAMDIHGFLDLQQFISIVEAQEVQSHSSIAAMLHRLHMKPRWWTANPLDGMP